MLEGITLRSNIPEKYPRIWEVGRAFSHTLAIRVA
jgi:hypothetical protein